MKSVVRLSRASAVPALLKCEWFLHPRSGADSRQWRMATQRKTPSGKADFSFAPTSYWRDGDGSGTEAEVVRIELSSSSVEVITLKARLAATGRILYRMIHEDPSGRRSGRIRVKPAVSARPLTFGELVELLERACYAKPCPDEGDDERYGGVIWGTLRLHLEHGLGHADDYLFTLKVTSEHYPELERYYAERLNEWCLANCVEDEDCGKMVRLRMGSFPRTLNPPGYSRP